MDRPHYLTIRSTIANLERARRWVAALAQELGFDDRAVFEIEISIYEACANVVEHAYQNRPDRFIDLMAVVEEGKFIVTIQDEGGAFEPPRLPKKDIAAIITEEREGGLGLYIMEVCMDEILYRRQGGKNILELVKYLPHVARAR